VIHTLLHDVRYAVRALTKSPGYSGLVLGTMALGIAATTAVYSVIDGVILRPLPFPEGDRFVQLLRPRTDGQGGDTRISAGTLRALQDTASAFDAVEAWESRRVVLGGAESRLVMVARASPGLLPLVGGRPPMEGRTFRADDPSDLVVVREDLWSQVGDPRLSPIGQRVTLDGRSYQIAGVMPASFRYPSADTQAWVPFDWNPTAPALDTDYLAAVARLAPGVSLTQGRQQLAGLSPGLRDNGTLKPDFGLDLDALNPFRTDRSRSFSAGRIRLTLYLLLGTVAFVLLICCANSANLMLARAVTREREIAVRRALGASVFRIGRQIVTEALLLSGAAGLLGAGLAIAAVRTLVLFMPPGLFWFHDIDRTAVSGRTLVVVIGLSIATGVATALVPTFRAARTTVSVAFSSLRGSVGGPRRQLRGSLVIAEVSLALMLLAGAGLLIRSFVSLQTMDPGFDIAQLAVIDPRLPTARYPTPAARTRFIDELTERVARTPAVLATARAGCAPPCVGSIYSAPMHLDEAGATTGESPVFNREVSPTYFAAMGIPLIAGRTFVPADDVADPTALIVSEATSNAWWPEGSPLGRRVQPGWNGAPWFTVVGVVGDVRQVNPDMPAGFQVYHPFAAEGARLGQLVVRTASPLSLISTLRAEARAIDPGVFAGISTMSQLTSEVHARSWFGVWLMTTFAGLGLVLAAGGIFAVVAYDVSRRTGELGLRMALGAAPHDVITLVLLQGARLMAGGVALGLVGSFVVTRLMGGLLFDIEPTDPLTLTLATAVLVGSGLLATYLPARRATRVSPVVALRSE